MQDPTFPVKAFTGFRAMFPEIKFTINIIFDQRYFVTCNELYKFLLLFIRHTTAQWVIKIGNKYTGPDPEFFNPLLQYFKINTINRICGYLNGFEPKAFHYLENTKI